MPDLICIWIRSVWPKPDTVSQNQIRSGPVLHSMIRDVSGRMQPSGKLVTGWLWSTPAWFQTKCVQPKPDQAIHTRYGLVLHDMMWAFFGTELDVTGSQIWHIYDPSRFWSHTGRNGHNWRQPKCFWIRSGRITGLFRLDSYRANPFAVWGLLHESSIHLVLAVACQIVNSLPLAYKLSKEFTCNVGCDMLTLQRIHLQSTMCFLV